LIKKKYYVSKENKENIKDDGVNILFAFNSIKEKPPAPGSARSIS
jgi:type IV secretory pathway VirB9-like protein